MGLSTINVEFKAAAQTAVKRSANGTVALILKDETKEDTTYVYNNETEVVKSHWTSDNLNYINMAFKGSPKKVIIERIAAEGSLDDALKRLANKKWNYLAVPSLQDGEVKTVADWIIAQRTAKKPFKAVLPHSVSNNIGIINFDTDDIKIGSKTYTTAEFCVYIASIIAGTALNESVTGKVISEISSITESLTPDADVDAGAGTRADDQRCGAGNLFDRAADGVIERRHHRGDNRALHLPGAVAVQVQDLVDFHRVLLLGAAGVGGHPRGKFDPVIFKAADDDVAVADIYCQNHFCVPPSLSGAKF